MRSALRAARRLAAWLLAALLIAGAGLMVSPWRGRDRFDRKIEEARH